jgi:predicted nucleic acid-binding protein
MRWFFGDGSTSDRAYAGRALDALESSNAIVPVTWGLEVSNVIARSETKGITSKERSEAFLGRLSGLDIEVDADTFEYAFSDTLKLARSYKLSSYDASYLELAHRRDLSLATLDLDLRKAAKKAGVKIFS